MTPHEELTALFADHCDFVELNGLGGKIWLHLCWNRNTATDRVKAFERGEEGGQWIDEHGQPRDWDYVYRQVVASGDNEVELLKDARRYKRLFGMTMMEYLEEQVAESKEGGS